ncbi:Organic solvent tolerance protein [Hirschia baltica ATCC 49814]|uniref:LPS-assembly protein LptD n=2 Tax=Hirschia TaxID=2723 RepID=C6XKP7_HIRBI|nr:Organic solvent tolerance protein [Hirschia baltica ATCC 49814]
MVSNFFRYAAAFGAAFSMSNAALAQTGTPTISQEQRVYINAERLIEDRDNEQVIYEGNVLARFEGRSLRADRVIYDRKERLVRAQGNVEIIDDDGQSRFADEIQVNENLKDGYALNFSSRLEGGAVATAAAAIHNQETGNTLEQMAYTACPVCAEPGSEPTWSIKAKRAVQNKQTQMISYQHAFLNIKGVPVMYIPYFAHPDPSTEKRSGLLAPDFGLSQKTGLAYEQPYYWAISPSSELTVSPTFYQNVNPLLGLKYKKRFWSGYVSAEGAFTNDKYFDSDGEKYGEDTWHSHLFAQGLFEINKDWKWGFGTEAQSDDLYDLRYDIDGQYQTRGIYASQSRSLLTQLYTQGQTETMYTEAGILRFQKLTGVDPATTPIVMPTIFAEKNFGLGEWKNIDLGNISVAASTAVVKRDLGVSSTRVTADTNWRTRSVFGPGLVLEPFAEIRGDFYDISDTYDVYEESTYSRGLGLAGAQISFPLTRRAGLFDIIIEPTAMAAWGTSGANGDEIPNEDSLSFEADESTLFKPNGASNYDLWEGGGRYSLGFNAAARWGKNNSINGVFGQRWSDEEDSSFNELTNLSEKESDYVASAALNLGTAFNLSTRLRIDKENFDLKRIDARATVDYWRIKNTFQYFRLDETLAVGGEEGFASLGTLKINDNWGLIAGIDRNIADELNIRQSYGVYFKDDCSLFQLTYERTQTLDRTIGPSESINFSFALQSLGNAGSNQFD